MKPPIQLFLASLFCVFAGAVRSQTVDPTAMAPDRAVAAQYTCVMHPEVVLDHPGRCPKCGMELVPKTAKKPLVSSPRPMHSTMDHAGHAMVSREMRNEEMKMSSSINLVDPMAREGSGTSWLPDSTPIYGRMFMLGDDMLMLHGAAFSRYTNVSTRRGDDRIDAPNWIMGMYSHPLGEGAQLGTRLMMSLDPLTEGGRGYPLLYQSGETWQGAPLHDRQHPHDLFSELSASYSQQIGHDFSAVIYFGYPGEPALGPPTFMHRPSAMDDPDAPLGHHWQDSTHVTFGVATAGLQWRAVKLEGSIFTGREPDENRYDFDRPRFDSYSGRISWNPTADLALQISHGYLHSPEAGDPRVNQHRTTASVLYNLPLGPDANWSSSFVWGQLDNTGEKKTRSFLVESNYQRGRDTFYTRLERVEKSGHELVLPEPLHDRVYPIHSVSFGYVRDVTHARGIDVGLGGQFSLSQRPDSLDRFYGSDLGYGFQVFLRVRPSLMQMNHSGAHQYQ